jgi:hypothetical protein
MSSAFFQFVGAAWCVALLAVSTAARAEPLRVCIDFPGGSALVEAIDHEQRVVRIVPTPHKDLGWNCWWHFKLSGIEPGETITLDVGEAPWATPDRASVSTDKQTWTQTQPGRRVGKRIVYEHSVEGREAWFAWGPPFTAENAARLVDEAARSRHATAVELCRSQCGRGVPALCIEQAGDSAPPHAVVVIARQHAWESGSSWVCRGLVEWLVSDDERAAALRRKTSVFVVPVIDVDNVTKGAGGKEQKPHDHNRDWSDDPHFPAVRAMTELIRKLDAEGRLDVFVDLHNPGAGDQQPFFFVAPRQLVSPLGQRNLEWFLQAAAAEIAGPPKLSDRVRESNRNYDQRWQRIGKNWVAANTRPHCVAVTLETPWNTPHGTPEGYRTVGRQLGLTLERYLRGDVRAPLAAP